ncbi:hypothetical protein [Catenulispora subtropica]|uniref:Uncharacterized protein n=1 Tax=Catenulispora subtropica TaxID=450798 RepID=A0ABN2T0Z0_9ACTN
MFDDDLVQDLVDQATPYQRALAATLCLNRASALAEDERADAAGVPGLRRLIDDSKGFCRARALGSAASVGAAPFEAEALGVRFREILGPDDAPYDEPDGLAAWFVDVLSIADYVVRTWNEPEESGSRCFDVLVAGYSLAGILEDDPEPPSPQPFGDLEAARQLADLRAVAGVPEPIGSDDLDALIAESAVLREGYVSRFQEVSPPPAP